MKQVRFRAEKVLTALGGLYMNKVPVLISVLIFLALPSFTLDLSTGYGLITGANFDTLSVAVNKGAAMSKQKYNQFHFGASVFFDIAYVVANINFYGTATEFSYNTDLMYYTSVGGNFNLLGTNLALGLRLKYPFYMDDVRIFPLFGMQGNIGLSQNFAKDSGYETGKKNNNYGDPGNWSTIALEAGAGFDIDITDDIYFRGNLVLNYKINSKLDQAFIKAIKDGGNPVALNLNLGFAIDLLVGYKLGDFSGSGSRLGRTSPSRPGSGDDIFYPK
jgi:hypothetical protein